LDNTISKYEDLGGELLEVPDYLLELLKQNNEKLKSKNIKKNETDDVDVWNTRKNQDIDDIDDINDIDDDNVTKYQEYAHLIRGNQIADFGDYYNFSRASANIGIPFDIFDKVVCAKMNDNYGNYDKDDNKKMYIKPHNESKDKLGWRTIYKLANIGNEDGKLKLDAKYKAIQRKIKQDLIKRINQDLKDEEARTNPIQNETDYKVVFQKLYPDFEKTHSKIVKGGFYIDEINDDVVILCKKKIKEAYEHISCGYDGKIKKIFIDLWMTGNDAIRKYDDMNIYPKASLCPKNIYNLWIPFEMEKYTEPYKKKIEGRDCILNLIKILCDNDEEVYQFVIKWIAQMIQYPEIKSYVITMISNEGAGKGTLMKLFAKMLGNKKVFETPTPSRDVWGSYNALMQDCFLVNLNELSRLETTGNEGKMKQLATDGTLTINPKGVGQFQIVSYHRFFVTTNKEEPIVTKKDDRRNLIIRSSDELINNKAHFAIINKHMDDNDVIRTCYDYFKDIKDMDKFGSLPIPKTEYQNNLKEGNREIIDIWLEDLIKEHIYEEKVENTSMELFNLFLVWCENKKINYVLNHIKFGVKLNNMRIDGITTVHTNKGNKKVFDIKKLKLHYGYTNGDCQAGI
jgi:hypothetical protein